MQDLLEVGRSGPARGRPAGVAQVRPISLENGPLARVAAVHLMGPENGPLARVAVLHLISPETGRRNPVVPARPMNADRQLRVDVAPVPAGRPLIGRAARLALAVPKVGVPRPGRAGPVRPVLLLSDLTDTDSAGVPWRDHHIVSALREPAGRRRRCRTRRSFSNGWTGITTRS
jgi:hypothetical protein